MYRDVILNSSVVISGVQILEPDVFEDDRGILYTDYLRDMALESLSMDFNHSKVAISKRDVLRGIHGDFKSHKLVSCVYGEVFQVAVDLRVSSPSYLAHEVFILKDSVPKMILLPPGVGNAFLVLSEKAVYTYKLSYSGEYIDAGEQFTFNWSDPSFNIKWPIDQPILSKRDQDANYI